MTTVEAMLRQAKYAQLPYWARVTGISLSTLRAAAKSGNLGHVVLVDGTILASKADVDEYARNRPKRGPKTD